MPNGGANPDPFEEQEYGRSNAAYELQNWMNNNGFRSSLKFPTMGKLLEQLTEQVKELRNRK